MKILHAIEGLELTSGVSLFCVEMCKRQVEAGHDVTLLYRCRYEYKPSGKVRVVRSDTLKSLPGVPDIVHMHGLWSLFNVKVLWWCWRHNVPYVVSPHGCLMPWAMGNGRLKKFLFFTFLLKALMRRASLIHVTTDMEKTACEKLGLECKYAVVPLGVTLPAVGDGIVRNKRMRTVLFLSRVSREKGVEVLLNAWKRLSPKKWGLVIAGPSWRGYLDELERKVRNEGIMNVKFIGSVVGADKDRTYRSADLFVLPSYAENFGSVVVEALSYGVPVIATKGTPWSVLEELKIGWWITNDIEGITRAMNEAMRLNDAERRERGLRGRKLVEERYAWSVSANKMMDSYKEVLVCK